MVTLTLKPVQKLFFSVALISFLGCTNTPKLPAKLTYRKYLAYKEGDTAMAFINKSKKIFSGSLKINHGGDNIDSGQVKGVVKGDTLIGEFHFLHYQLEWKRKPIAFLMKKDHMIMGEGLMKLTVGIPHFDPTVPIDFNEKERFVFKEVKN